MSTVISDDEARANIAKNLQRILRDRGLSQPKLASMTNEPVMSINRMVRGQNTPGITLLAKVAEALDTSIDRLISAPSVENLARPA